jgi:hypothetical protein
MMDQDALKQPKNSKQQQAKKSNLSVRAWPKSKVPGEKFMRRKERCACLGVPLRDTKFERIKIEATLTVESDLRQLRLRLLGSLPASMLDR